ncbi:MAG TPA: mechanosensitive ion channel family protein [Anaerolineae bacterium]|nr:mechanosensitive ion channel family protein [Anaerolineae bacterium]
MDFEIVQQVKNALAAAPLLLLRLVVGLLVFTVGCLVTWLVQRLVVRMVRRTPGGLTVENALARVIVIAGVMLAILTALATVGVDVAALVATLGLTSLAIGLALKDTIENAITGVLLLIQRPFGVGDVIKVGDITGTVADVAIRTTNIKTFDGLHVLIPNRHVYNEVITNWSYYAQRRVSVTFGVAAGTDLAQAYRILSEAMAATPGVLAAPVPQVSFEGFDENATRLVLRFWFDWRATDTTTLQTQLTRTIKDLAQGEDADLSVPIRTMVLQPLLDPALKSAR